MSFDITGSLKVLLNLTHKKTLDLSEVSNKININQPFNFTYGTGANQINVLYQDTLSLADGANTTLNLYDSGTLTDAFGVALTMEALKLLYVKNNSDDANLLLLGGNSADIGICSNATDQIIIPPGGVFVWINSSAAGLDITTNKNLRLAHDGTGSTAMDVDILIGGLD
jgi:hypothetical protein